MRHAHEVQVVRRSLRGHVGINRIARPLIFAETRAERPSDRGALVV
jgi:hypothetical protein